MIGKLTFINITLSGRHHFAQNCETEDWCTHCLDLNLLVTNEDGSYETVIDHYKVNTSDSTYEEWQAKCGPSSVFQVLPGAVLTFDSCDILDIRYRPYSFISLNESSLILINSNIQRMEATAGFIRVEGVLFSSVSISSCYVTGLNRDHAYNPDIRTDSGFLFNSETFALNLSISNSIFEDNLVQETLLDSAGFIDVASFSLEIIDSQFLRCTGGLAFNLLAGAPQVSIRNVTFQEIYGINYVLFVGTTEPCEATMRECRFIDNLSYGSIVQGALNQDRMLYHNNRVLKNYQQYVFYFEGSEKSITNSVFIDNGAFDWTFEAYWADYFLDKGLINDNGLTAEKAELQTTSLCSAALFFEQVSGLTLLNLTLIEDQPTPCNSALVLSQSFPDDQNFICQLSGLLVRTLAMNAIVATLSNQQGTLYLENTVLERGGRLLWMQAEQASFSLLASNVTFQYATGTSPVSLTKVSGTFSQCQWKHNIGYASGALAVYDSSLEVSNSLYFNNSCLFGAGDMLLAADDNGTVVFRISSTLFTYSQSPLGAACISVTGNLSAGAQITNCTFHRSLSDSGALFTLAHYSGQLLLTNLTLFDIHSVSTSLIMVLTPTPTAANSVGTMVAGLKVLNSTFYRGLWLLPKRGSPVVRCRSNYFEGNRGIGMWISAGDFSDWSSEYRMNTGLVYYQGGPSSNFLQDVLFASNSPSDTTGLLYLEGRTAALRLLNCTFRSNYAPRAMGLLALQQEASAALANCQFEGNRVYGAVIFAHSLSFTIESSSFTNDSAVLHLEDAEVLITSSIISEAQAFSTLRESNLVMQNSTVSKLAGTRSCLLSSVSSNISFMNMTIEGIQCDGEVVSMSESNLRIVDAILRNVESRTSVMVVNTGDVSFVLLTVVQAKAGAELITVSNSTLTLSEVSVTDCSSSVLSATKSSIALHGSNFARIHSSQSVGVLVCSACISLSIVACTFQDISAWSVAGVRTDTNIFTLVNSHFRLLEAGDTGALQVEATSALISNCWFLNNTASSLDSSGGALRLNVTNGEVITTHFRYNSARSGGAVHWIAGTIIWQNNTFLSNVALFGPNVASFLEYMQTDQDPIIMESGNPYSYGLTVRLLDHFQQVISTDYSTTAMLNSSSPLSGHLQSKAIGGLLIFSGFSITLQPGSSSDLTVVASKLSLLLTVITRNCQVGEAQVGFMCVKCSAGTYSLSFNATQCQLCPNNAQCPGGSQIFPDPTYWRPNKQFEGVFKCPFAEACLGHINFSSEVGHCAQYYTGNMCQSCAVGAERIGRDHCSACTSSPGQKLRAVGLSFWLVGLWMLASAADQSGGGILRIVLNYLQFIVLVVDFDLTWPDSLEAFYYLHRFLGNAPQYLLPFDCMDSDSFFDQTLATALAPFAVFILFTLIWTAVWLIRAMFKLSFSIRERYASSLYVSFTYLHCFIVRVALAGCHCITIAPGESWLRAELAVRCWDERHLSYMLVVSLPTLLLWGLGVPAALLLLQIKQKRTLLYMFRGIDSHRYYWELVMLSFKSAVAVIYVFVATEPHAAQALTLVLLLTFAVVLQSKVTPYQTRLLNRAQLTSLLTMLATAYSGLYFTDTHHSSVLVATILLLHCWFALTCFGVLFEAKLKAWLLFLIRRS